jgi:hypothetical protein
MIRDYQWCLDNFIVGPCWVVNGPYELENISSIIPTIESQDPITKLSSKRRGDNNDGKTSDDILEEDDNLDGKS